MKPVLDRVISDDFGARQFERELSGEDAQAQALALQDDQQDFTDGDVLDGEAARAEMDDRHKQWAEWDRSDDLAEPLMGKLVSVTVDGERYRVPVGELANGYMMQSDYSEKLRQVYELRDQVLARERGLQTVLGALDKGPSFIDMMVYLGKFPGFAEAAIIYGTQLDAEQRMSPEQREVVGRERAARARANQLEIENRQLKAYMQQQQQPQVSRTEQYYMRQLEQMVPVAIQRMAKRGIEWVESPFTLNLFEKHWATLIKAVDGKDLTTEFVENALIAVMQEVQKLAKAGHIQLPKPLAAGQLPPVSNLQGPTQSAPRRNRAARISDLSTMVHRR